jgi:hypothetical protein
MSVPGIHEYSHGNFYTGSRQPPLDTKRPIIGKVSSFFNRRSVTSPERVLHYLTFNAGYDDGEIKARKFDAMISKHQDSETIENVDDAFEQLMVSFWITTCMRLMQDINLVQKEYGLPSNLKPNLETLTVAQKKTLLESYRLAQHDRPKPTANVFPTERMKMLRPLSILTKDAGNRQSTRSRRQRTTSKSTMIPEQAAHMLHISNINSIDVGQLTEILIMLKSTVTR